MLFLLLLIGALTLLYLYFTRNDNYWKKRGVPFLPPTPIFGNLRPLMMLEQAPGVFMGNLYNAKEALGKRFVGIFLTNGEPALFLRDPELIKQIYVKDFAYFNNRNVTCNAAIDPIGYNNLFVIRDEKWKYLRSKLSPTFTSGKIKQMFKLVMGVADELIVYIENKVASKESVIETKEMAAKYTTDVISTAAFGIQSNSLNDPTALFRHFGRLIFHMTIRRAIEVRSFFFMHWYCRLFRSIFLGEKSCEFFREAFWDAMETRKNQGITRNDFLDTLMQLKADSLKKIEENPDQKEIFNFDGDSLVAQSVLFFTAGFETTATTISSTLTELACHPDVQEKLRKEMQENIASHNGELTYEGLFEMKYLDKVVSEVLRKYPAMPFIDRVCTKDYKIPDSDLIVRKGTPLFVSLYNGLHYDPEHFPDPQRFDPERFSEEEKAKRHSFAYIPFGEGPHICIGMRFALMNVKTALTKLLTKYRVEKTHEIEMPLKIDERAIILTVKGGLNLKFVPLE